MPGSKLSGDSVGIYDGIKENFKLTVGHCVM